MAYDMFLQIKEIPGESVDDAYEDAIDIVGFSLGVANSGGGAIGSGSGTGRASFDDIHVTKYVDAASHALFLACAKGTHHAQAVIIVRKAGDKPLDYLKITLNQVVVSSQNIGGSKGGDERVAETITLNYAKIKIEYAGQDEKGIGKAIKTAGYDIRANKQAA